MLRKVLVVILLVELIQAGPLQRGPSNKLPINNRIVPRDPEFQQFDWSPPPAMPVTYAFDTPAPDPNPEAQVSPEEIFQVGYLLGKRNMIKLLGLLGNSGILNYLPGSSYDYDPGFGGSLPFGQQPPFGYSTNYDRPDYVITYDRRRSATAANPNPMIAAAAQKARFSIWEFLFGPTQPVYVPVAVPDQNLQPITDVPMVIDANGYIVPAYPDDPDLIDAPPPVQTVTTTTTTQEVVQPVLPPQDGTYQGPMKRGVFGRHGLHGLDTVAIQVHKDLHDAVDGIKDVGSGVKDATGGIPATKELASALPQITQ